MSSKSDKSKGTFFNGPCLNVLCFRTNSHYHKKSSINTFNAGPVKNHNNNDMHNSMNQQAILNAYTGINEKRAQKVNMQNAIKVYKTQNRKSAKQSLKNNRNRRTQKASRR